MSAATPAANPFAEAQAKMQELQVQQATFSAATQAISAGIQAQGTATNLIVSAHQNSANNAKNIGQNMVETSRR